MREASPSGAESRGAGRGLRPVRRARRPDRLPSGPGLDRWIRRNIGACTFLGMALGVFVSRKFLILPFAAAAVAVQDALRSSMGHFGRRRAR